MIQIVEEFTKILTELDISRRLNLGIGNEQYMIRNIIEKYMSDGKYSSDIHLLTQSISSYLEDHTALSNLMGNVVEKNNHVKKIKMFLPKVFENNELKNELQEIIDLYNDEQKQNFSSDWHKEVYTAVQFRRLMIYMCYNYKTYGSEPDILHPMMKDLKAVFDTYEVNCHIPYLDFEYIIKIIDQKGMKEYDTTNSEI